MRLLLDTHIWIWSCVEPQRIASQVFQALNDAANERLLSPISIWEIGILVEKRKVKISGTLDEWFARSREELVLREAPMTWAVAREERTMGWSHKDPADRFLAATARVFGLTMVTADERLMNAPGIAVLANG
jgi:PIN domain nuclease of toxin-antitoxin system